MPSLAFNQLLDTNVAQLYSAATAQKPDGNLVVSPLSILYASALIYIGSSGSTKSNLDKSFHFDQYFNSSADSVLSAFSKAMPNLTMSNPPKPKPSKPKVQNGAMEIELEPPVMFLSTDRDEPFILNLANVIFVKQDAPLMEKFRNSAVNQLQSEVTTKDFQSNPEKARGEINTWVSDMTNGRIKDLLPQSAVSAATVAVLANALYFKASWESSLKFNPRNTEKRDFTPLNGQTIQVDTMSNFLHNLAYAEDGDLDSKYIEYTYTDNQGAMLFILPNKKDGLRTLEKKLTANVFGNLKKKVKGERVSVQIPKFKVEADLNLKSMLQKIGVKDAFDKSSADFSNMTPQKPVWIGDAFHKTFVEIDEKGTEAAAASAFVMWVGASRFAPKQASPKEFIADHPFIFAIRHNPTNAILFIGRVEKL
ncbi:leukocyte elastase inhibitor-like [Paramacrobiotus metropolitanus]|uniref:leukocyte elastase inhibitor-like n=1 Tax=Paramacrobiotus metropolitanus TaxID=2943436 RepID=UPI002445E1F1|nr:leukocyte elastase inhibitor-like [Paramacrobiotus metropolitanus]